MKYLFVFLLIFSLQQNAFCKSFLDDFLIARSDMLDPLFKETVIIMLYHNQTGAAGLVVNKPIKTISIEKLLKIYSINPPKNISNIDINLYWGGPVESNQIFFIHSSDYKSEGFISSNENFTVTSSPQVLIDIAKKNGPKKYLILFGIAAWNEGQLDLEIMRGSWEKKSSSYSVLFKNDNEMWSRLLNSKDI